MTLSLTPGVVLFIFSPGFVVIFKGIGADARTFYLGLGGGDGHQC